jgi:hypothetical protein
MFVDYEDEIDRFDYLYNRSQQMANEETKKKKREVYYRIKENYLKYVHNIDNVHYLTILLLSKMKMIMMLELKKLNKISN